MQEPKSHQPCGSYPVDEIQPNYTSIDEDKYVNTSRIYAEDGMGDAFERAVAPQLSAPAALGEAKFSSMSLCPTAWPVSADAPVPCAPAAPAADSGRGSTHAPDDKVLVQRFINVVENKASIVKQNVRSLWAAWDRGHLHGTFSLPQGLTWRRLDRAFKDKKDELHGTPAVLQYRTWCGKTEGKVGPGKFQMFRLRALLNQLDAEIKDGSAPEEQTLTRHQQAITMSFKGSLINYSAHIATAKKQSKNTVVHV